MNVELRLPKLGAAMTEGLIANWRVNSGDLVRVGDVLCEVESDKATIDIESEWDATVKEILISAGQTASVGTVIAILWKA